MGFWDFFKRRRVETGPAARRAGELAVEKAYEQAATLPDEDLRKTLVEELIGEGLFGDAVAEDPISRARELHALVDTKPWESLATAEQVWWLNHGHAALAVYPYESGFRDWESLVGRGWYAGQPVDATHQSALAGHPVRGTTHDLALNREYELEQRALGHNVLMHPAKIYAWDTVATRKSAVSYDLPEAPWLVTDVATRFCHSIGQCDACFRNALEEQRVWERANRKISPAEVVDRLERIEKKLDIKRAHPCVEIFDPPAIGLGDDEEF